MSKRNKSNVVREYADHNVPVLGYFRIYRQRRRIGVGKIIIKKKITCIYIKQNTIRVV